MDTPMRAQRSTNQSDGEAGHATAGCAGARAGQRRQGTAAVEMAIVAPIIFLVFFACVEFGRVLMVVHGLEAAAREGCRFAITWDSTTSDVENLVQERLATFGITNYTLTMDPDSPASACQWEPIRVRITASYGDVTWLPAPRFLRRVTLSGFCTLPQETDRCNSS